jgi:hypothetical protein
VFCGTSTYNPHILTKENVTIIISGSKLTGVMPLHNPKMCSFCRIWPTTVIIPHGCPGRALKTTYNNKISAAQNNLMHSVNMIK